MAIQSLGLGTGLPLNDLLSQLQSAEKMKLQPISVKHAATKGKISAFGTLQSSLTKLQDSIKTLNENKSFTKLTTSMSGTGVQAVAGTTAAAGSYQVEVKSLAKAHMVATTGFASKTDAIAGAGSLSLSLGGAEAVSINIAEGSSLESIRNQINSSAAGVTASIVNTGDAAAPFRLTLQSKQTGLANEISVSFAGSGELSTKLSDSAAGGTASTLLAATDAELVVNGLNVTSSSNTIEGALQGVTMTVTAAGPVQTMSVAQDTESLKTSITNFVDAYNSYVTSTKTLTAFNEDPTLSGKLLGDTTLRSIENNIRKTMNTTETSGEFRMMAEFGVKLNPDGKLSIEADKLDEALATKPDDLQQFFVGDGFKTGFAGRLNDTLDKVLRFEGTLENITNGLNKSLKAYNKQFTDEEARIAVTVERYRVQFAAMDNMVAEMNSTMGYLSQQFEALAAQTSSK